MEVRGADRPERATHVPHGSCDSQIHIFGDVKTYPPIASRYYDPPDATYAQARSMLRENGLERVVLVQPTVYGTNNQLLLDVLEEERDPNMRGVAAIDDTVSDAMLERLHAAGVRGVRFIFWAARGRRPDMGTFRRTFDRIRPFGWHTRVFATVDELLEIAPVLEKLEDPIVLDHLGHLYASDGMSHPAFATLLGLLRRDNYWMMLSNGNRWSATGYPWSDIVPIGSAFYRAAPGRCIWSSDWPFLKCTPAPNTADLLELVGRYLPDDAARAAVLVDNPARLLGFRKAT
jgi:2-pyrone-4,6-dicarboxylate lactonase